eukprot:319100-Amphidinium_carterae.1
MVTAIQGRYKADAKTVWKDHDLRQHPKSPRQMQASLEVGSGSDITNPRSFNLLAGGIVCSPLFF